MIHYSCPRRLYWIMMLRCMFFRFLLLPTDYWLQRLLVLQPLWATSQNQHGLKPRGNFLFITAAFEDWTCSKATPVWKPQPVHLSCLTSQIGNSTGPSELFCLDRTLLSELGSGWCKCKLVCFCNHRHVLSHWLPTDLRMTNVWSRVSQKLLRAYTVSPVKVCEAGKHLFWILCQTHLSVDWMQVW